MSTDKDKPRPPPATVPDDDGDDDFRSAADDPTAVWDEDSMKNAGLSDLLAARRANLEPPPKPAATPPEPARTRRSSVEVATDDEEEPRSGERPGGRARALVDLTDPGVAPSAATARRGLSWPVTIALAVALGAVVYLLVRLFKG